MNITMNPSGGLVQSAVNAPMTVDIPDSFLNEALQFREMMMMYTCAIREVKTKLEVLNDDLAVRYQRNPIQMIKSRVKKPLSILEKLKRRGYPVNVLMVKDYIRCPKVNGYRSYHMIIEIPVFFSDRKEKMRVEVQIRTMAMDFWASLDHQMKYKKDLDDSGEISEELKECAEIIAQTDLKMQSIRQKIENRADPSRLLQFDKD